MNCIWLSKHEKYHFPYPALRTSYVASSLYEGIFSTMSSTIFSASFPAGLIKLLKLPPCSSRTRPPSVSTLLTATYFQFPLFIKGNTVNNVTEIGCRSSEIIFLKLIIKKMQNDKKKKINHFVGPTLLPCIKITENMQPKRQWLIAFLHLVRH